MVDKPDALGKVPAIIGAMLAKKVGLQLDREPGVKPGTKELLKTCLPGLAEGIASACPDGTPIGEDGQKLIIFATHNYNMAVGAIGWPPLEDFPPELEGIGHTDLWAAIADAIDRGDAHTALYALIHCLGPDSLKIIDEECAKYTQDGFTPCVLVVCRKNNRKAAGLCTTSFLPSRADPVLH